MPAASSGAKAASRSAVAAPAGPEPTMTASRRSTNALLAPRDGPRHCPRPAPLTAPVARGGSSSARRWFGLPPAADLLDDIGEPVGFDRPFAELLRAGDVACRGQQSTGSDDRSTEDRCHRRANGGRPAPLHRGAIATTSHAGRARSIHAAQRGPPRPRTWRVPPSLRGSLVSDDLARPGRAQGAALLRIGDRRLLVALAVI